MCHPSVAPPEPTGPRPHLRSRRGTEQAPCSPHQRSHFRRAGEEAEPAAGPPSHPRPPPPSQLPPAGASPAVTGEMERHRRRGRGWPSLPRPQRCMPRSRTAPPHPPCPSGLRGPSAPAALPPWRGRPAARVGRSRRHSRCQGRYILPEPLPPPSSRLAGPGLSVTQHRPGGRAGLRPGPAASERGWDGPWPGSGCCCRARVLRRIKRERGGGMGTT